MDRHKIRRPWKDTNFLRRKNRRIDYFASDRLTRWRLFLRGFRKDALNVLAADTFAGLGPYLSEIELKRASRILPKVLAERLIDKTALPDLLPGWAHLIPANHILFEGGQALDPATRAPLEETALEGLPEHLILKPADGVNGRGVTRVLCRDGAVEIGPKRFSLAELAAHFEAGGPVIVCTFVNQPPDIAAIFPGAVNTARVLSYIGAPGVEPVIAAAALRIGTRLSAPVDNASAGGLSARIDLASGTLSAAAGYDRPESRAAGRAVHHSRHPDTGAPIEGVALPGWASIRDSVLKIARALPAAPLIGWDLALTEADPGIMIIEANPDPNVNIHQMHAPLLQDPAFHAFLARNDALMRRRALFPGLRPYRAAARRAATD
ncbi:MAG: hypothetical protein HKN63_11655 [Rhodobacteraceae bacterium]|nr:hypothetical protein [Paracoccaceae bacterium]